MSVSKSIFRMMSLYMSILMIAACTNANGGQPAFSQVATTNTAAPLLGSGGSPTIVGDYHPLYAAMDSVNVTIKRIFLRTETNERFEVQLLNQNPVDLTDLQAPQRGIHFSIHNITLPHNATSLPIAEIELELEKGHDKGSVGFSDSNKCQFRARRHIFLYARNVADTSGQSPNNFIVDRGSSEEYYVKVAFQPIDAIELTCEKNRGKGLVGVLNHVPDKEFHSGHDDDEDEDEKDCRPANPQPCQLVCSLVNQRFEMRTINPRFREF